MSSPTFNPILDDGASRSQLAGDTRRLDQSNEPFSDVPFSLKSVDAWVIWRYQERNGNPSKVPYHPTLNRQTKANDRSTWSTFQEAVAGMSRYGAGGIGFMLQGSEFVGLDFDGVVSNGVVEPYALEILRCLGNPYSELSPSGLGIRAFVKGTLPAGGRKFTRSTPHKFGVEIYSGQESGRYLTVTGNKYAGEGIPECDLTVAYVLCQHFLNDKFRRLWMGDVSDYDGDESKADLALCGYLARSLNNDPEK